VDPAGKTIAEVGIPIDQVEESLRPLRRSLIAKTLIGAGVTLLILGCAFAYVLHLIQKTRRLEAEAQVSDRRAHVATLAREMAHEIRNPLNAMSMNLEMLEEELSGRLVGGGQEVGTFLAGIKGEIRRLKDLAEDPHGIYDCTHCFKCIDACPKGVAPMSQIMRLRRIAGSDEEINDRNNGHRHETAFVKNIRKNGLLHEADLLPDSYGGKFHPRAVPELVESLPVITTALLRRKVTPTKALLHPHRKEYKGLRRIFDEIEDKDQRLELNLYVTGVEDEPLEQAAAEEERGPHS